MTKKSLKTLLIQIDIDPIHYNKNVETRTTATVNILNERNEKVKTNSILFNGGAAQRFGWAYKLDSTPETDHYSPCFEILKIFRDDSYLEYDRILYLDTDTYYYPDSPNILEYYPEEGFHAVSRMGKIFDSGKEPDHLARLNKEYLVQKYKKNYFNSGVLLLDKNTIIKMRPYLTHDSIEQMLEKRGLWSDDQSAINIAAHESGVKINPMHEYWNQMDKRFKEGYIVHLKGSIKNRENVFDERAKEYLNAVSSSN
tara:strand:+ start:19895 stop:20659 length:765 start_codon:yes stop_codon:yes gene_type:complete